MGKFKRNEGFGSQKRFDDRKGFRPGGRSERPEMHRAVCSECGKACEVPFRPSGDKPVFCSDCFGRKDSSSDSRESRFERRGQARPSFGDKPMFRAVCDKCGKTCEVPFRPSGDKPVYCSDCFGKGERSGQGSGAGGSGGNSSFGADQHKKQFEMLNSKLDSILKILSANGKALVQEKPAAKASPKVIVEKAITKKVPVVSKPATVEKAVKAKKASTTKKPAKKSAVKKKK